MSWICRWFGHRWHHTFGRVLGPVSICVRCGEVRDR